MIEQIQMCVKKHGELVERKGAPMAMLKLLCERGSGVLSNHADQNVTPKMNVLELTFKADSVYWEASDGI
eukprot:7274850-Pyramimonas_sp.AAC.1